MSYAPIVNDDKIENIGDVEISGLTNNQILQYNSGDGKWKNEDPPTGGPGGVSGLNDLSDVTITSPRSVRQYLRHDGSDFKNSTIQVGDIPILPTSKISDGVNASLQNQLATKFNANDFEYNTRNPPTPNDNSVLRYDTNSGNWKDDVKLEAETNGILQWSAAPTTNFGLIYYFNGKVTAASSPTLGNIHPDSVMVGKWTGLNWVEANLGDLGNVDLTGLTNGQVLKYNSTSGKWTPQTDLNTGTGVSSLDALSDVNYNTNPADGQPGYDPNNPPDNHTAADGDVLYWNASHTHWMPLTPDSSAVDGSTKPITSGAVFSGLGGKAPKPSSSNNNKVLKWNGSAWESADIGDLGNVDLTGLTDNQILKYNSTSGKWTPQTDLNTGTGVSSLDALSDVSVSNPQTGQMLRYDGNNFVNTVIDTTHIGGLVGVLNDKAPKYAPTFTGTATFNAATFSGAATFNGTVSGINKSDVGLNNVDNTADSNKPVSTAQQTEIDKKATKPTSNGVQKWETTGNNWVAAQEGDIPGLSDKFDTSNIVQNVTSTSATQVPSVNAVKGGLDGKATKPTSTGVKKWDTTANDWVAAQEGDIPGLSSKQDTLTSTSDIEVRGIRYYGGHTVTPNASAIDIDCKNQSFVNDFFTLTQDLFGVTISNIPVNGCSISLTLDGNFTVKSSFGVSIGTTKKNFSNDVIIGTDVALLTILITNNGGSYHALVSCDKFS